MCEKTESDALCALCTQLYSVRARSPRRAPESPSARSLSRSSRRSLSASLSLRVSQSVSQSAGATRFARIAPYAKSVQAGTHAREGSSLSSDIIHPSSLCFPLPYRSRGWTTEHWNHLAIGEEGRVGQDPLLRAASDIRSDSGVKSQISHASKRTARELRFQGRDKRSRKRCPLHFTYPICILFLFFFSTTARGKGRSSSSSSSSFSHRCRACNTWRWHRAALVADDYYAIGCGRPGRGDGARSTPGRRARPAQAPLRERERAKAVRYLSLDRSAADQDIQRYSVFYFDRRTLPPFAKFFFPRWRVATYLKYVSLIKFNTEKYSHRVTFLFLPLPGFNN